MPLPHVAPLQPTRHRRTPEQTTLYQVVAHNLETFFARLDETHRNLPYFVRKELRSFLDCGILSRGFARVHCSTCGRDELVAFSCKGRGFCPSCGARRMYDTAAWLVDRVLPWTPVRQWVLALPHRIRFLCAFDPELCRGVRKIFVRANIIIPTHNVASAAGLTHEVEAMRAGELSKLVKNVRGFLKSFESLEFQDLSAANVQELVNRHNLGADELLSPYTKKLRHKRRER